MKKPEKKPKQAARKNTIIRADSLPVNSCLSLPWKEFCALLHRAWAESTALANWAARELDRRDVVRLPGMKKLPPMPAIPRTRKGNKWLRGLYGLASVQFNFADGFWKGAAICASSVIRAVERKYRRERFKIVWGGEQTSARYRYPFPVPVHSTQWDVEFRDGAPVILLTLAGQRLELKLRGGPEFGRQLGSLRMIAAGTAKKCQLLISRQRSSASHRQTIEERSANGAERVSYRIMVKVITAQVATVRKADRVFTLVTDPAALWVGELDGRRAWIANADHIARMVRWREVHTVRRQRWAEDCKAEKRRASNRRRQFEASRERCCVKYARRMDSWCKEQAAEVAGFCVRNHVGIVAYSDADKSFMPGFCWAQLQTALANALARNGIELVAARESHKEEVVLA